MNFDLTDDQRMLVDTVTTFVKKESPVSRFRQLRDEDGVGFSREVSKKMGDLGWLAIPFAEDVGGMGGSFVLPAVLGNAVGGVVLVALLNYGQVHHERTEAA